MPVELNCASSLIAVHQAVTGLRLGEVDLALVGGANAVLSAGITREMADLQLLSPEGRCKSFDASADGFVRGEGCGMVVLKRLSRGGSRRGPYLGGDLRLRLQSERRDCRRDGAQRPGAGAADGAGARAGRRGTGGGRLPGGPRRRLRLRRPHRGTGGRGGLRQGARRGPPAPDGLGQDQHRPSGIGGRDRWPHQGRAGDEAGGDPAAPTLRQPEHTRRMGDSCRYAWRRRRRIGRRSPAGRRGPASAHSGFRA